MSQLGTQSISPVTVTSGRSHPESAGPTVPAPRAMRLRRPTWRDRRLIVGVVLVLLSIVLATTVLSRADDSGPGYVAAHALVPGQRLTGSDLRLVHVQLGGQQGRYLTARPAAGAVVIRTVPAGDLVPRSAVGSGADVDLRPVPVAIPSTTAKDLRAGALVDLWVSDPGSRTGTFDAPVKAVSAATVASVESDGGVLSTGSDASVDVLLDQSQVPQILAAVDAGARIAVVPLPGSVPRAGS